MTIVRFARTLRGIALILGAYSLVLIVTGGFDLRIGSFTLRSHNIERFVTAALAAWALAWLIDRRRRATSHMAGSSAAPPEPDRRPARPALAMTIAAGSVVVLAMAWGAATIAASMPDATPDADMALLELYTREAASGDLLVGPYSRFRWHHPGPATFYLFAPFYKWAGDGISSLRAAALVWNLAVIVLTFAILILRAPPWFAAVVVAGIAACVLRVPDLLTSPWNPHVVVLPLVALTVVCAAIAGGAAALWPVAALLASFIVQSHLSVAPVAGLLIVATAVLIWRTRSAHGGRGGQPAPRHLFWVHVAGWVAFVIWIPSLIHELRPGPGNVGAILHAFFVEPEMVVRMRDGLAAALLMLASPVMPGLELAWGGEIVNSVGPISALVTVGSLAGLWWLASRAGPAGGFAFRLGVLSLVVSLTALWSATRIQGDVMDQLVFWMSAIGAVNLSVLAAAGAQAIATRLRPRSPVIWMRVSRWAAVSIAIVSLAAAATLGMMQLDRSATPSAPDRFHAPRIRHISDAVIGYLEREDLRRPLVRLSQQTWGDAAGVYLDLLKRGYRATIEPDWVFMFGPAAAASGQEDSEVLITGDNGHPTVIPDERYAYLTSADWPAVQVRARRTGR